MGAGPAVELCDRPVAVEQVWGRSVVDGLRERPAAGGPYLSFLLHRVRHRPRRADRRGAVAADAGGSRHANLGRRKAKWSCTARCRWTASSRTRTTRPGAPFHFVGGIEAAVAKARELAGGRLVEVAAGDIGGQVLAAGLADEVRMDVVPVVFGSGKRFFGSVDAQHLLEDPDVVVQGDRVLHLRCPVRR